MNSIARLIIRKFYLSIAILGLTIGFLVLNPSTAQADTSVALDTANDLVKVATVYKTKPNKQTEVLSDVLEFEESTLPKTPGFVNSSILKGQDGTEVVALTQWQDLPSFEAYSEASIRPLAKVAIAKYSYLKKAHNYKYQQLN